MPTLREAIAKNLPKLLETRCLSQTDVANALEVSFQAVNGWVNGRGNISAAKLAQLCELLGVEETDLCGWNVPLTPAAREIVALLPAADQAQATDDILDALRARLGLPVRAVAAEKKKQGHR